MSYVCCKVIFVHVVIYVFSECCVVFFKLLSRFQICSSHCLNKVNKFLKYMNEFCLNLIFERVFDESEN